MMEKKRSVGVTIFGIFAIFMGIAGLWALYKIIKGYNYLMDTHIFSKELLTYSIISSPILSILDITSGVGILKLKSWGKNIFVGLAVYSLLGKFILLCFGITQKTPVGRPLGIAVYFILYGYIIYFFTRPKATEGSPERAQRVEG